MFTLTRICYLILFFSITSYAQIVNLSSQFTDTKGDLQTVTGYGVSIQSHRSRYLVSPYHVAGGKNDRMLQDYKVVYSDPVSDIIIYRGQVPNLAAQPALVEFNPTCNCMRTQIHAPITELYHLANDTVALVEQKLLDKQYKRLSRYNQYNNWNNFGQLEGNSLVFEAETKKGFSGAPVIQFGNKFAGFITRFDANSKKTYLFPAEKVFKIIDDIEKGHIKSQATHPTDGYSIRGDELIKKYNLKLQSSGGGDTSDGGDGLAAKDSDKTITSAASGLVYNNQDIAYFKLGDIRLYPNQTSYEFLRSMGQSPESRMVLSDQDTERVLYPFQLLKTTIHRISAFEFPVNARSQDRELEKTTAQLINNQLHLSLNIQKPNFCSLNLVLDQNGILIGNTHFQPLLQLNSCGLNITLDFRSFLFSPTTEATHFFRYVLTPKLKLTIENTSYNLEFRQDSDFE